METQRSYILRGSPDCPIAVYYRLNGAIRQTIAHWHPELELMIVTKGSITYRMDRGTVTLCDGDILVIPPGTIHAPESSSPSLTVWSIVISPQAITMPEGHVFQTEFVVPLQDNRLAMPTVLHPGDPAHTALYPPMTQLPRCTLNSENYKINRFATAMAICTALQPFCQAIAVAAPPLLPGHRAVKECMRYIRRNYSNDLTVSQLANHVHLQTNYLCTLFKEHTGQTVMEYLSQVRVDAAAYLLRTCDLPIVRVAEKSGFRSESAFFRHFRELMGQTPKAYRRQQTADQSGPENF